MGDRDLDDYVQQYRALPFEPVQLGYRRRTVLRRVAVHRPRTLLEVGCGLAPLFTDLPDVACTVVEPIEDFAAAARAAAHDRAADPAADSAADSAAVRVVRARLEDLTPSQPLGAPFDMVVVGCLLHEVEDPQRLLAAARRLCATSGVLHVNVPAAGSLHRRLAVAAGLAPSATSPSETQRRMQQSSRVYDPGTLADELTTAGFEVVDSGALLVKPFTHGQMQQLVDSGFLTTQLLDGLDELAATLPELGSEIWVDARPTRG